MPLKTILVYLTTKEQTATLTKAAATIARRTGAHVIGLYAAETLAVYPRIAMHIPRQVYEQFVANQRVTAEGIKEQFNHHTKNEDFISEFRLLSTKSTTADRRVIDSARAADLVIMSQEDLHSDRSDQNQIQDHVIRDSGRPVLVIPLDYDGPEIGNSLLLGWCETREATRAAHDLLSLAAANANACLLSIGAENKDELEDHGANALASTYARHGLRAKTVHREKADMSISEMLHREAFEQGADVIVTGAFGHSRSYDFIIGAATRDLLHNAKLPVMFSK